MCVLLLNFTKSAPAVSSVNNCTGSDFETSRIARTGNEKSSSIACARVQIAIMHSRSKFTNEFYSCL